MPTVSGVWYPGIRETETGFVYQVPGEVFPRFAVVGTDVYRGSGSAAPTLVALTPDIQSFGAGSATWTKPTGAKLVTIYGQAAGGGGGSGRRGAAGTIRSGGGGGGAGGQIVTTYTASDLPSSINVTVGAGGAGGAAVTADDTNGNAGIIGGHGFVGAAQATSLIYMFAGGAGVGGTATGAAGGAQGFGISDGALGGAGSATGLLGANGLSGFAASGGGAGGGLSASDVASVGGNAVGSRIRVFTGTATGGAANGTSGAAGTYAQVTPFETATTGGAGGGSGVGVGGSGGLGATGSGGGGGAASVNTNNSGAGGAGGDGRVVIVTQF